MCDTSPSGDELRAWAEDRGLPGGLTALIVSRYQKHGGEYIYQVPPEKGQPWDCPVCGVGSPTLEERTHHAPGCPQIGKPPMNAAMFKDNLQDVEEELVDAVFNALIYLQRTEGKRGGRLMSYLGSTWEILQDARKAEVEA